LIFIKSFLKFSTSRSIQVFLTQALAFQSLIYLIGALLVRVFVSDQREEMI